MAYSGVESGSGWAIRLYPAPEFVVERVHGRRREGPRPWDRAERMKSVLEAWAGPWRERAYATHQSGTTSEVDPETIERLRELGYMK